MKPHRDTVKKVYKTLRVNEAEYALISDLQRLVKRKGYDALRKVLTPAAAELLDGEPKFTKGLAIAVSCQNLVDMLEWR